MPSPELAAAAPPRRVATSLDELLAGAARVPMAKAAESLSDAAFERVVVEGRRMVVKHLGVDTDWTQRALADYSCRPVEVWRLGILDALPACIDHAVAGSARWTGPSGRPVAALLMDDVGEHLVGDDLRVDLEQHRRFLDHMAALHAAFWGWHDVHGLLATSQRYLALSPAQAAVEVARGSDTPIPGMVLEGWPRLARVSPRAAAIATELLEDPAPLVTALEATPQTFIHGDWKFGNLGSHPDGRTILLDWAWPGESPACADLAWYLCTNCHKLPESKEATIDAYRAALEGRGIATEGWWDRQLGLCMVGAFLQQGWSKWSDASELGWWEDRVLEGARHL